MKEYQITKKQCQQQIDKYNNCCDGCGGKITPIETVDNADNPTYWSGCEDCQKFTCGTKNNIFSIARKMVIERKFNPYSFMKEPTKDTIEYDYWLNSQIAGATRIVEDILRFNNEIQPK